ncbi:MAG: hypothetical protein JXB04_10485 [Kiritimatiellae bacterium]|nr:hypothetical protein [Kiritimatiellia bacterium]
MLVGLLSLSFGVSKSCTPSLPRPATQTAAPLTAPVDGHRIQIVGDQFYLDGVRLLVKASFYEYHPVGTNPWEVKPPREVIRRQLRELKDAGFNAIRWFNITPEGLAVCEEEGMLVFVQFWIDHEGDFSDPNFRRANLERLRKLVRECRKHWNIIGYLVTNEPNLHTATSDAEIKVFMDHLFEIRDMVKQEDPGAFVSYDDWPSLAWLDHSMWDFIAFNVYTWSPIVTTRHGMGYRPYLEHLKRTLAPDRPLVILEYGVSCSPNDTTGYGYGGWSEEGQAEEAIKMLTDILAAGSAGACYTHFADQIWKGGSNAEQDDNPEEWFGMLALDPAGGPEMKGRWRPVYHAHMAYYMGILLEPAPCATVRGVQRILLHSEKTGSARFRIGEGDCVPMTHAKGPWWVADWDTTTVADGLQRVEVIMRGPWGIEPRREAHVVVANHQPDPHALDVKVETSAAAIQTGDPLTARISVRHKDASPAADQNIHWGVYEHRGWGIDPQTAVTGDDGTVAVPIETDGLLGMVTISAGVDVEEPPYRRAFGDLATVRVGMD